MILPIPTKRAVIDPLRKCNIRCRFCYYRHMEMESVKSWDIVKQEIQNASDRGNNYIDFTGGEPTLYPEITEAIQFALSIGMKSCIITNGLVSETKTKQIIDAGLDEWLVSIHGLENTHNFLVDTPNARKLQERFLEQIKQQMTFRFNCVINGYNQAEIYELSQWMVKHNPTIVNFINFNPHHNWGQHEEQTKDVLANLRIVEPLLNKSIELLESYNIGVNLRYYPMCRVDKKYRRCVCNDLHVIFDPYEWDYEVTPKTFEKYYQWGINTSINNECKTGNCSICGIKNICGGINKVFDKFTDGKITNCVEDNNVSEFYDYRKHNILTLKEKI